MRAPIIVTLLAYSCPAAFGQISLPFKDGLVSGVQYDGQSLYFVMDTGLSGTYVVYKDWYEKTYGKGACKSLSSGCYSCPGPCNPYAERKDVATFADGSTVTSVLHEGTLTIGKNHLRMQFRVIIGFSPGPKMPNEKPQNYLGLAFRTATSPQTVPRQLFLHKLIKEYAVSVCSPGSVMSFTGTLILGDPEGLCPTKSAVTTIPMIQPHEASYFDSELSSYGLVSSTGTIFTQPVQHGSVIYDTGVFSIYTPKNMFETLLNKIASFSGPGVYVKFRNGVWFITDKGYSSFPTLTFSVGDNKHPFVIRIPPNQYAIQCDGKWCVLALIPYDEPEFLLGRPFFSTYFSSFNMASETVSIAEYGSP